MKYYEDKYTVCPFYIRQKECQIHCEGASTANVIHLIFGSKKSLDAHKERFCKNLSCYPECPIYNAINTKYK